MNKSGFINPRFWFDERVRKLSAEAKLIAVYLLTIPRENALEDTYFYSPFIENSLCLSREVVERCLAELVEIRFIRSVENESVDNTVYGHH